MRDRTDVCDVETLRNCFTLTAVSVFDENDMLQFVLHEERNDLDALIDYVTSPGLCLIGYNIERFDYPVIHKLKAQPDYWRRQPVRKVIKMIYDTAIELIQDQNDRGKRRFYKYLIPVRDVMLIWHLDNFAKHASLKWIQCAIGWRNVEDMPFNHSHWVSLDEIPKVLSYNLNDVLSTRAFYLHPKTQEMINMRYDLSEIFGMPMHNWNNAKIGERIILHEIAKDMGISDRDIMQMRTNRDSVDLSECILHNVIRFESPQFTEILRRFNSMIITTTKKKGKKKDFSVVLDGMQYFFGLGGIHAVRGNNTFDNKEWPILSIDVSSFYANLSIENDFKPEHLGSSFSRVYKWVYVERKKWPKTNARNRAYKEALVCVFGKSNSEYSPLRDPKMTMQITINGQLFLAMLCEKITLQKAGKVLMANTDGIEIFVYDQQKVDRIIQEWQDQTRLTLEPKQYKKLTVRDVNNYIAVDIDGNTKEKGAYEVEKINPSDPGASPGFHKDASMKIVARAVRENVLYGTPVEQTIMSHNNIDEFLMMKRAKTGEMYARTVVEGNVEIIDIPKTLRYYVSKSGITLMTRTEKKNEKVHQNAYITIFNRWIDRPTMQDYGIDYTFYIREANGLLHSLSQPKGLFE